MESFLRASEAMRFEGETRQQVNPWMERVLCQRQYHQQGRAARGLVRRYVGKMTGLSRAQGTRLIACYRRCGRQRNYPLGGSRGLDRDTGRAIMARRDVRGESQNE